MVRQFDDISRAIGNIEGQFASFAKQTSSDLQSLRDNVDTIIKVMNHLPPSPQCIEKHNQFESEISSIKVAGAKHVGFVTGIAISGSMALQWILSQFGFTITGK